MAETFFRGGKKRRGPIVKGGSPSGCLVNTTDLTTDLSYGLSMSAPARLN